MTEGNGVLPLKCRRKKRWTQEEAVHHAKRLGLYGDKMNAYHCEYCGMWHVGHSLSLPESVEAVPPTFADGVAERRRLGAEIAEINASMARLRRDRPNGYWTEIKALEQTMYVRQQRIAFVKAWITEQAARQQRAAAPKIAHASEVGEEWGEFFHAVITAIRAGGDPPGLRKLFGKFFAIACADSDVERERQRQVFVGSLGRWLASRSDEAA